jgi:hypothetical protein
MKALTMADTALICVLGVVVVASHIMMSERANEGIEILIEVDGRPTHKASLTTRAEFAVEGAIGSLVIAVQDNRVAVIRAQCPNHVCERTGWRSSVGDIIVCVPNKTVIRVLGPGGHIPRVTTG